MGVDPKIRAQRVTLDLRKNFTARFIDPKDDLGYTATLVYAYLTKGGDVDKRDSALDAALSQVGGMEQIDSILNRAEVILGWEPNKKEQPAVPKHVKKTTPKKKTGKKTKRTKKQ